MKWRFYHLVSTEGLRETCGWIGTRKALKVGTVLTLKDGPEGRWMVQTTYKAELDHTPEWRSWKVGGLK